MLCRYQRGTPYHKLLAIADSMSYEVLESLGDHVYTSYSPCQHDVV
jgi:hypothetical protein